MILTDFERSLSARIRLESTRYPPAGRTTLPPARIAMVPFSLDEVEAQPEDADGAFVAVRLAQRCSCSHTTFSRS
ncbi:MAG: hypothetical protein U0893_28105 [Chloroflexota bacterium]